MYQYSKTVLLTHALNSCDHQDKLDIGPTARPAIYQGQSSYWACECSVRTEICADLSMLNALSLKETSRPLGDKLIVIHGGYHSILPQAGRHTLNHLHKSCQLNPLSLLLTLPAIIVIAASWWLSADFWPLLLLSPSIRLCSCPIFVSPALHRRTPLYFGRPLTPYSWCMVHVLDSLMEYKSLKGIWPYIIYPF